MNPIKYSILAAEAGWQRVVAGYDADEGDAFVVSTRPIIAWAVPLDDEEGTLALALTPLESVYDAQQFHLDDYVAAVTPAGQYVAAPDVFTDETDFLKWAGSCGKSAAEEAARKAAKLKPAPAKPKPVMGQGRGINRV